MQAMQWLLLALLPALAAALAGGVSSESATRSVLDAFATHLRGNGRRSTAATWDYHNGGASWSDIGQCASNMQSPINVTAGTAVVGDGDRLFYNFKSSEAPIKLRNDGKGLSVLLGADFEGHVALGKTYPSQLTGKWKLHELRVHTPSEHTFNGQKAPLELQMIHKKAPDSTAVEDIVIVAIGFQASSSDSEFLQAIVSGGVPMTAGDEKTGNGGYPHRMEYPTLFRSAGGGTTTKAAFWQYTGSLTEPPCTVGIRWLVRHESLPVSHDTLDKFVSVATGLSMHGQAPGNARKLQPSVGYPVVLREAEDASTLPVFKAPGQEQFDATVANTRAEQEKVKDAVEQSVHPKTANELSKMYSAEYIASHQGALALQDHSYQTCLREMDRISKELVAAQGRAATQCGGESAARNELEESGAGITHLEAANRLNGQRQLCSDEEQVVATLEQQTTEQAHKCQTLQDKAADQVARAALGEAAAGTAAANDENEDANVEQSSVLHAAAALTGTMQDGVDGVAAAAVDEEADKDHEDAHESGNTEAEQTMEDTGQGVEDTINDVTDVSGCDSIVGC